MIFADPNAVPHIAGMSEGTLTVESFSHRDPDGGFKFNIRCSRCGATWKESYRRIVAGFLKQGCHNTACRLNRIEPPKISAHEKAWSEPEPAPAVAPEPVKPEPIPEWISTDYLRYVAACRKVGQSDIRSWSEFRNFGDFLHKHVMAQVRNIEEKHGE